MVTGFVLITVSSHISSLVLHMMSHLVTLFKKMQVMTNSMTFGIEYGHNVRSCSITELVCDAGEGMITVSNSSSTVAASDHVEPTVPSIIERTVI